MSFEKESLSILRDALDLLEKGFQDLPEYEPSPDINALRSVMMTVAEKMQDNYPYHHPLYAGQMLKPPHPIARLAYMLAMWINPNNHALDGSRASSPMEKEAVADIAAMFGWETHLGHLTSGGTVANMEGLWIASCEHPGKAIAASAQSHYTHHRLTGVLGIPFIEVPVDERARMDVDVLKRLLQREDIGTVVVTIGTTATGSIDPLPEILALQGEYDFRIHADTAYGGYFTLVDNLGEETRAAYDLLSEVDSLAIDPHKHGLQPYGCGCILFKDPAVGRFYKHDSPYTYFTSSDLHLGEITLECSRGGASAVGLWATHQMLPLVKDGELASDLAKGREAALDLFRRLDNDSRFTPAFIPQLDIVVWAVNGQTSAEASRRAQHVFDACAGNDLHLALVKLPGNFFKHAPFSVDEDTLTCLRSCLMKPEHLEWMPRIWDILDQSTAIILDEGGHPAVKTAPAPQGPDYKD